MTAEHYKTPPKRGVGLDDKPPGKRRIGGGTLCRKARSSKRHGILFLGRSLDKMRLFCV